MSAPARHPVGVLTVMAWTLGDLGTLNGARFLYLRPHRQPGVVTYHAVVWLAGGEDVLDSIGDGLMRDAVRDVGAIPGDPAELIDWDAAEASARGGVDASWQYVRVEGFTVERRDSRITATREVEYAKQAGVITVPSWTRTITDEIPPPTVEQFERMRRGAPIIED